MLRTLAGQLGAGLVALATVVLSGPSVLDAPTTVVGFAMAAGIGLVHCITVMKPLRWSTIAFDAAGTAVILAGTGGPHSPFFVLALAGGWWAAHVPRPRSGIVFAIVLIAVYTALVLPASWREGSLQGLVQEVVVVGIIAALSDFYVKIDRRAVELSEALSVPAFGDSQLNVRQRLARALQAPDLPVDAVIAAGQLGLTAQQAELLGHLVIGLTNREIGEALGLSEAGVRYRLTRLYRALGVRGRHEAAARALALGLTGLRSDSVQPAPSMPRSA